MNSNTVVEVGQPKGNPSKTKRHVVVKVESGWALLCDRTPAKHEGVGFLTKESIQCDPCFKGATAAMAGAA